MYGYGGAYRGHSYGGSAFHTVPNYQRARSTGIRVGGGYSGHISGGHGGFGGHFGGGGHRH
jgi:hypothetical protein